MALFANATFIRYADLDHALENVPETFSVVIASPASEAYGQYSYMGQIRFDCICVGEVSGLVPCPSTSPSPSVDQEGAIYVAY